MTIESYLSRIADALEAIAATKTQPSVVSVIAPEANPRKQKESANVSVNSNPVPAAPAPVVPVVPSVSTSIPATVDPDPVNTVVSTACPFTDAKGLIGYVMDAYKSLGPTKGALIQNVLTKLGVNNINEVQAKDYQALWSGIEELKK